MDAPSDYEKCVVILDGSLPRGLLANAAAILGATLGRRLPETVGPDAVDRSGRVHPGIVRFPVPVLQGTPESLRQLRAALEQPDFRDLTAVDFSELAQACRTYDEFLEKMGRTPESALRYLGVAVCGPKKKIGRLTGRMPLLR